MREEFVGVEPYGAPQIDVPILLNVNENPYPPSEALIADMAEAVAHAARTLNRYPDREAVELRQDLCDYLATESGVSLDMGQVWAANGSNEVMSQLLAAFAGPGRTVMSCPPTYSMYPEYARNAHSDYVAVPRGSQFGLDMVELETAMRQHSPAVLLLASPNNPTGTALSPEELERVLHLASGNGPDGHDVLVVVDEAYGEFRREGVPSALELLATHDNLVVTRTMSKAFGAAGLRLGYLAACQDVVDQVRIVRLPYHLSAITQAAARAALSHADEQLAQIETIRQSRARLINDLHELGLSTYETDANFVLTGHFEDTHAVFTTLVEAGILIREVGPPGHIRITVGTEEENTACVNALKDVLT